MPKFFFGITFFHAHAHYYICIVCAKYQKASIKAMLQVDFLMLKALLQIDFLMYALPKHKHNPYLTGNRKKWLSSQSYYFVKN